MKIAQENIDYLNDDLLIGYYRKNGLKFKRRDFK